jgi:hypothetical protein
MVESATASKTFTLTVKADPAKVLEEFRKNMYEESLLTLVFAVRVPETRGNYVGRIQGNDVEVEYYWYWYQQGQPYLKLHVASHPDGCAITGQYCTARLSKMFFLVTLGFAIVVSTIIAVIARATAWEFCGYGMLFVLALLVVFLQHRHARRKLFDLVADVARKSEAAECQRPQL